MHVVKLLCLDYFQPSLVDKPTKPVKRKRSHVQSTSAKSVDSNEEGSKPSKCQSEVVKLAYLSVGDYPINDEKKLQRLATRGGTAKHHIPMGTCLDLLLVLCYLTNVYSIVNSQLPYISRV